MIITGIEILACWKSKPTEVLHSHDKGAILSFTNVLYQHFSVRSSHPVVHALLSCAPADELHCVASHILSVHVLVHARLVVGEVLRPKERQYSSYRKPSTLQTTYNKVTQFLAQ